MMITKCLLIVAATIGLSQHQPFPGVDGLNQNFAQLRTYLESVHLSPLSNGSPEDRVSAMFPSETPAPAESEATTDRIVGSPAPVDDLPLACVAPATELLLTEEILTAEILTEEPLTEPAFAETCQSTEYPASESELAATTVAPEGVEPLPIPAATVIETSVRETSVRETSEPQRPEAPADAPAVACDVELTELQAQWSGLSDQTKVAIMMLIHADELTRSGRIITN